MRAEKKFIGNEYVTRLNASPFFIVVDYRGVTVKHFNELRKRLAGQIAVVTGQKDVSAAAKILKNFQAEFDKPKLQFGYLNSSRLEAKDLQALADLPSIEVLRSKLLGLLQAPATTLVRLLNTPG